MWYLTDAAAELPLLWQLMQKHIIAKMSSTSNKRLGGIRIGGNQYSCLVVNQIACDTRLHAILML